LAHHKPAIRISPPFSRLSWAIHYTLVTASQHPRDRITTPSWIAQEALMRIPLETLYKIIQKENHSDSLLTERKENLNGFLLSRQYLDQGHELYE
jgi:hypothetical protein